MKTIFLHGMGQSASDWDKTVALLENKEDVVCLDLLTMMQGQTITYQNIYQKFSEYCQTLQEPFHLVGLSLGGILALDYTIKNPEKVGALAVIGAQHTITKGKTNLQNFILRLLPEGNFAKVNLTKQQIIQIKKSMIGLDLKNGVRSIKCPTLVLCGEQDQTCKKEAQELGEWIPDAELNFVPNSDHEVNVDNPESLSQELNSFYAGQKG